MRGRRALSTASRRASRPAAAYLVADDEDGHRHGDEQRKDLSYVLHHKQEADEAHSYRYLAGRKVGGTGRKEDPERKQSHDERVGHGHQDAYKRRLAEPSMSLPHAVVSRCRLPHDRHRHDDDRRQDDIARNAVRKCTDGAQL